MLPSFANDTIVVLRPALVEDSRHNLISGDVERHTITGCSVQPGATDEDMHMRDTVTTRWTAYLPPNADIQAADRVEWAGRTYLVDGEPERWVSPTGMVSHVKILLVDWEG